MTVRLDFLRDRERRTEQAVRDRERDYQRAVSAQLDHGRWTWAGGVAAFAARVAHMRLRAAQRAARAASVAVDQELWRLHGLELDGDGAELGPRDTQELDDP